MDNDPDVSLFSYDEFIKFFFDRPAEKRTGDPDKDWIHFDFGQGPFLQEVQHPERIVEYLTALFQEFQHIAARYSLPQLNQALWAIWGWDFNLQKTLWNSTVELSKRVECIRSMHRVYASFMAKSQVEVMENCFDMWWDWICTDFWSGGSREGRLQELSADSSQVLEAMFETLVRILQLDDPRTQAYALHGLGHLHHPGVKQVVQAFLKEHRKEFSPEGVAWVERCRDGTVM